MGEIADMMLEGFLDEETGEVIDGDSPGYPRRMSEQTALLASQENQRRVSKALPHPCPGCGRSFKHKGDLKAHRMAKDH